MVITREEMDEVRLTVKELEVAFEIAKKVTSKELEIHMTEAGPMIDFNAGHRLARGLLTMGEQYAACMAQSGVKS